MDGVPHIMIYRLASIKQRNVVAAFLNASRTFKFFFFVGSVQSGRVLLITEVKWTGLDRTGLTETSEIS